MRFRAASIKSMIRVIGEKDSESTFILSVEPLHFCFLAASLQTEQGRRNRWQAANVTNRVLKRLKVTKLTVMEAEKGVKK